MPLNHLVCSSRYSLKPAAMFAAITFVSTWALDVLTQHDWGSMHHLTHRIYACSVVFFLFLIRSAFLHDRLTHIDDYQTRLYYDRMRVMASANAVLDVMHRCKHNHDADHALCQATARKHLRVIRHVAGEGPDPILLRGELKDHPLCINLMDGTPRCKFVHDLRKAERIRA